MTKGFFLVIDGIDGSGKTTQVELLKQYLASQGLSVEMVNFPRYGQNLYADLVEKYLKGEFGEIGKVDPHFIALCYAGDRMLAREQIEQWLNEGKVVIANRYVSSSKAHLGANIAEAQKADFIKWVDNLEYQTNQIPREDLTILLKLEAGIGQENALDDGISDIHEENISHLHKAAKIYLELAENNPAWTVVNCMENGIMQTKESISREIVVRLKTKNLI